jgi:hypothetical protein
MVKADEGAPVGGFLTLLTNYIVILVPDEI